MSTSISKLFNPKPARGKLSPLKHPGEKTLKELREQQTALKQRLSAANFAYHIIGNEFLAWSAIVIDADLKAEAAKGKPQIAAAHLAKIATSTRGRYQERLPDLKKVISELTETTKRVTEAIAMIEVDHNLRAVTDLFAVDGFDQIDFNMTTETREIQLLLHTTDALLEIES